MMRSLKCIVTIMLTSAAIMAQPQSNPANSQAKKSDQKTAPAAGTASSRTFTGTIVNATCSQASSLTNRASFADRSGAPSTSAEGTKNAPASSTDKDYKSVYDLEGEVLQRCPASNNLTAFAVVTDDGSFYKLDNAGNNRVKSLVGSDSDKHKKSLKNMRVTVTGTVQEDTLQVQSLSKSDKPFGSL